MESVLYSMTGIIPGPFPKTTRFNFAAMCNSDYKESLAVKRDPVKEGRKREGARKVQKESSFVIGGTTISATAGSSGEGRHGYGLPHVPGRIITGS